MFPDPVDLSQLTFTRSNETAETLEKVMFKVIDVVLVFLLLISNVSVVDFEHVNVSWVKKFRRPSLYFLLSLFQILSIPHPFPCRLQPPPLFLFQLSCFFR